MIFGCPDCANAEGEIKAQALSTRDRRNFLKARRRGKKGSAGAVSRPQFRKSADSWKKSWGCIKTHEHTGALAGCRNKADELHRKWADRSRAQEFSSISLKNRQSFFLKNTNKSKRNDLGESTGVYTSCTRSRPHSQARADILHKCGVLLLSPPKEYYGESPIKFHEKSQREPPDNRASPFANKKFQVDETFSGFLC